MSGLSTLCPIAHVPPPFVFALYFPGYVLDLTLLGLADSSCFSQVAPPITLIPFLASGSMLLTLSDVPWNLGIQLPGAPGPVPWALTPLLALWPTLPQQVTDP